MAAVNEVQVPDIGDFTDVPVIEVLVKAGDEVAANDPLIVLESEKATLEVPSPGAGTIEKVAVAVGDKVSKGDLILTLSGGDEGGAGEPAASADDDESSAEVGGDAGDAPTEDAAAEAPTEDASRPDPAPQADEPDPAPAASTKAPAAPRQPATAPPAGGPVHAGPAARRAARELGIDLATVAGSGREGRVTLEDVARAARDAGQGAQEPSAGLALGGLPPWPEVDHASFGEVERVDLPRVVKISGPYLARNWVSIPHVTQFDEADITDLEAFRKEVNADHAHDNVKVTMVSLLIKACAAALREFPTFNASLDGDGLIVKRYFNIGFAVDTPAGLLVPVIRDADRKGLLGIARELTELSAAARDGKLPREAMQGGTFTISSLGGIGGTAFTPIINAPELAILGVSRSQTKPVWDGRAFVPRLMLPLSLSYDHRAIDGAAAARFSTRLTRLLADPREMLL